MNLNPGIEKITLHHAKRLQDIAPMMRFKGRIKVGTDLGIAIFNSDMLIDKVTFENAWSFLQVLKSNL